ncbi:hypothetical protein NPE88_001693 [Salmonella enterica]|nr:hypothetical protein [Salmonella enterica subsp. enterica serovar Poona]EJN0650452.1 hypothetical protein [Salmonella enterica]ELM0495065.1 hypothetical protein [Salmonella enterica]
MKVKEKLKFITSLLIISILIIYSFALGKYKVFPYEYLWSLKNQVFSSIGIKPSGPVFLPEYYIKKPLYDEFKTDSPVVALGDSLIEYGTWEDILPGAKIANRGIAGDTTDGLINRLYQVNTSTAKQVILMIGTNDLNTTSDVNKVADNYHYILSYFNQNGVTVNATSVLYVNAENVFKNEKIKQLNSYIKEQCDSGLCTYTDLNRALSNDGKMQSKWSPDGVHLNAAGYDKWKDQIKNVLNLAATS